MFGGYIDWVASKRVRVGRGEGGTFAVVTISLI